MLSAGEADFYLPYLFGLDGVTEKSYELANISMQFSPKQRHIVLARAALDCAYESMAMRGTLAIVAAGNYGGYGTGIMNALACSRWIVGVGAAYADGRRLWEQSSWGIPNDPIIHRPLSLPESKFLLQARN